MKEGRRGEDSGIEGGGGEEGEGKDKTVFCV